MHSAIGIDFGGTSIKSGLVRDGRILQRGTLIHTPQYSGAESLLEALKEVVAELRRADPDVRALGIGLPGIVDSVNGVVHELTNVPGWNDVPLRDRLERDTGLCVTVENDANAMAYGEWKYGAAKDGRHVVCITLGTGVGGGLILNGQLYRGAQLGAGEAGHMSIDYRGVPGPYGNFGALERYVGNNQIAGRALELYSAAGVGKTLEQCAPAELAQAARSGDVIARGVWEAVGAEVGAALASIVWLLNPDTIVIGGGVAKARELLFEPILKSLRERTLSVFHEHLRVVAATLDNDAGIIGNAALALDSLASRSNNP
jgi:glucokinase